MLWTRFQHKTFKTGFLEVSAKFHRHMLRSKLTTDTIPGVLVSAYGGYPFRKCSLKIMAY